MNYRHIYHAGSFSDVIKHCVLIALLNTLKCKETPFCFLDTHAGSGLYELNSEQTQKTQEYQNGFAKLLPDFLNHKKNMPDLVQQYLSAIMRNYADANLPVYPGSPLIAQSLLRENDKMIFSELHPDDYKILKNNIGDDARVALHHQDAYLTMKAFLPPKEKRGLVLIDPPFEVIDEFDRIENALKQAIKHWRSGHFMIWYPLKNKNVVENFYRKIDQLKIEYLIIHFNLEDRAEPRKLSSCGILLLNPPWKIDALLANNILPYLSKQLHARWEIYGCNHCQ